MLSFVPSLLHSLLLALGCWMIQDPARPPASVVWPRTAGVYAMTEQGVVQLKISGERSTPYLVLDATVVYARGDIDRIPAAETVQSVYVNMVNWQPKDLYLLVGRDRLTAPLTRYQRLAGRAITRGIAAVEIVSADLEPASLAQAIRRLTPSGTSNPEAYIVLELKSTAGLNDRAYPVRITAPRQ